MKKKKKKRVIMILLVIIILVIVIGFLIFRHHESGASEPITRVVDSIDKYGYTLDDRDTTLMKDTYKELKEVLNAQEMSYEEYAKNITELFIIDLFTINNKKNKYDVGGSEYVYPDAVANFKLNVENTIYKTVKTKEEKNKDFPEVKSIDVANVTTGKYSIGEDEYDSFIVEVTWEYQKELGYDKKATVTSILKDDYIYIVEYSIGE